MSGERWVVEYFDVTVRIEKWERIEGRWGMRIKRYVCAGMGGEGGEL